MMLDRALLKASWQTWGGSPLRAGPYWLQWVWTLLFCAGIAAGFTILGFVAFAGDSPGAWRNLAGWSHWYGRNFIVSLSIGALIQIVFDRLRLWLRGRTVIASWKAWQRTLYFSSVPLLCTVVGWPLGVWLAGANVAAWASGPRSANLIVGSLLLSLLLTFIFHQYFSLKARQHQAEKNAADAQLRLLQGQIEPHFLFNTLANVISLMTNTRCRPLSKRPLTIC